MIDIHLAGTEVEDEEWEYCTGVPEYVEYFAVNL